MRVFCIALFLCGCVANFVRIEDSMKPFLEILKDQLPPGADVRTLLESVVVSKTQPLDLGDEESARPTVSSILSGVQIPRFLQNVVPEGLNTIAGLLGVDQERVKIFQTILENVDVMKVLRPLVEHLRKADVDLSEVVVFVKNTAVNFARLRKYALEEAGIEDKEGLRTGIKMSVLLLRAIKELRVYKLAENFFERKQWTKDQLSLLNLEGLRMSPELSRDFMLFPDNETFNVTTRFLQKVFPEDPLLSRSLLRGLRSELAALYDEPTKTLWMRFNRTEMTRADRSDLFKLISNSTRSEVSNQFYRSRYRRWRRAWFLIVMRVRENAPQFAKFMDNFLPPSSVEGRNGERLTCTTSGSGTDPFRFSACREAQPALVWVPLVLLFGIFFAAVVAMVVLLVRYKAGDLFKFALLAVLGAGSALRITFYSFWSVAIGETFNPQSANGRTEDFAVSFIASDFVERTSLVLFAGLLMIFALVLVRANISTFAPERTKLLLAFSIIFIALGVIAIFYSFITIVLPYVLIFEDPIDFARVTLSSLSVFYAFCLVAALSMTLYYAQKDDLLGAVRTRTLQFLICSCVLCVPFVLTMVFSFLYTFVAMDTWGSAYIFSMVAAEALLALAVLAYCFLAVYGVMKKEQKPVTHVRREDEVPLLYSNY